MPRFALPCLVATVVLLQPDPLRAAPCAVPDVAHAAVRVALDRLATPAVVRPPQLERWRALLPIRVTAGVRTGVATGDGWSDGASGPYERFTNSSQLGYTARMEWDLRPLWAQPLPPRLPGRQDRLRQALQAEELGRRVAIQVQKLRAAQGLATQAEQGDFVCHDAQSDAEGAMLVLEVLMGAAARP